MQTGLVKIALPSFSLPIEGRCFSTISSLCSTQYKSTLLCHFSVSLCLMEAPVSPKSIADEPLCLSPADLPFVGLTLKPLPCEGRGKLLTSFISDPLGSLQSLLTPTCLLAPHRGMSAPASHPTPHGNCGRQLGTGTSGVRQAKPSPQSPGTGTSASRRGLLSRRQGQTPGLSAGVFLQGQTHQLSSGAEVDA